MGGFSDGMISKVYSRMAAQQWLLASNCVQAIDVPPVLDAGSAKGLSILLRNGHSWSGIGPSADPPADPPADHRTSVDVGGSGTSTDPPADPPAEDAKVLPDNLCDTVLDDWIESITPQDMCDAAVSACIEDGHPVELMLSSSD